MISRVAILALLLSVSYATDGKKSFDFYKVYRIYVNTEIQRNALSQFLSENDFDIWKGGLSPGHSSDIMVPPEKDAYFLNVMEMFNLRFEVLIENVQELINREKVKDSIKDNMTWDAYYTLEAIQKWLDSLPKKYPGKVEVFSVAKTHEGRDLKGIKISLGSAKRSVIIEGGIHAREWISPATVTYIINELLTSDDPKIKKIANNYNWYLFPNINPDGYAYSHVYDRFWRKNRAPYGGYYGVDLGRNFPFHWGIHSTSTEPDSCVYGGPFALSEKESKGFADFITKIGKSIDFYIDFHSFSQVMIIPYANTTVHIGNYNEVFKICTKAKDALSVKYGTKYRVGNNKETLHGLISGVTADWAKDLFNIPVAFTYELRDTGNHGFDLPPEQIIPNCKEIMDSLITVFEEAKNIGVVG